MASDSIRTVVAPSRREVDQPSLLARALEPATRALFMEAGVRAGMRVLDVSSGVGDVAFVAREIVGPQGSVTGFDSSAASVSYANDWAAFRGLANVRFIEGQIGTLSFESAFDVIVGRVVLMYSLDPVRDLRALVRHLKPGGLVIFQEFDLLAGKTVPSAPVIDQVREWLLEGFSQAGIELEMGPKLYSTFTEAGLMPPEMRVDGFIGGEESVVPQLVADAARMLMPQLEALGITTEGEVHTDTLEKRMRADLARTGGVMSGPPLIGAWARLAN
jgi:ubiquinone/menaquinone biosynthesis C-methylase UbiE